VTGAWVAYCHECNGGGKVIAVGGKRLANQEAGSHFRLYGHHVTIMARKDVSQ
jgi:hypothetical protein